ncbi:MAG: L-rhamnose mutarotase [Rhizobiales bacterium]|nr:L-rhamnose mutarotase [Hyphomicrobiales bacterium]NRB12769.1 L-rhamnose mutarotase [Hyphomicrobiales bacterium]
MKKMGFMIGLKPDQITEYKRLHADVWPEILQSLTNANISNYSIFLREPENLLFSYWEYVGQNFEADMQIMASLDITKKWWELCMPCQQQLASCKKTEWWAEMEQVFYHG